MRISDDKAVVLISPLVYLILCVGLLYDGRGSVL
jgi:hypothetical protein